MCVMLATAVCYCKHTLYVSSMYISMANCMHLGLARCGLGFETHLVYFFIHCINFCSYMYVCRQCAVLEL
jgi:hypothetical protein